MQFRSGEWVEAEEIPQQPSMPQQIVSQKISVVLPFIEKEKQSAIELLTRSQQLCGRISRTIFLVPFKGMDFGDVRTAAEGAFATVATIQDCEGVLSDWSDRQQMRSAAGPNSSFRQVAWFFYLNKKFGSWLWLEPDCWPVTSSWLYDLEREYFDAGKPFMGVRMTFPTSGKQYMNGVGIYPWNAIQYAPLLVQSAMWTQHPEYEVGFDVAGGNDVLNNAHMSRRIQLTGHLSKRTDPPTPETALCHGRPDLSGKVDTPRALDDSSCVETVQRGSEPRNCDGNVEQGLIASELRQEPAQKPIHGVDAEGFLIHSECYECRRIALESYGQTLSQPPAQEIDGGDAILTDTPQSITECIATANNAVTSNAAPTVQPARAAGGPSSKDGSDYGAVTKRIRDRIEDLVEIWDDQPHRKVLIVKELRKAKLVPKHFR